jgi:hypothetical protein
LDANSNPTCSSNTTIWWRRWRWISACANSIANSIGFAVSYSKANGNK